MLAPPTSSGGRGRGCGGRRCRARAPSSGRAAARSSTAEQFSSTCAGRLPPGITQVTASFIRIQRSAKVASVRALGDQRAQLLDRRQADLERDAREGLAAIERRAVAVEVAVVVARRTCSWRVILPASIPDDSGSRARMPTLRRRASAKKQVGRALAEDVVDELHRLHAGVLDRLQRLLDPLDADAVEADLAGLHQVVEHAERLGVVVDVGRRAVQLQQVDAPRPPGSSGCARRRRSGSSGCSPRPSAWGAGAPALVVT